MMRLPLHQESSGEGDVPLVCLHGWGMNLRVFDGLRASLMPGRRVIAIDLPGHGASPWQVSHGSFDSQVESLLQQLPARCALLGWSLGGQLALALCMRAPNRITQLVLVSTTPRFAAGGDWAHGMSQPVLQRFAEHLAADWRGTLRDFLQLQVRGSRDAAAALALLEQALHDHGQAQPEALSDGLQILQQLDLRAQLPQLDVSTLVITGQHDRVTPPGAGVYLAQQLPRARHVELARAGHAPFLSHPTEFTPLLREFLYAD